MRPCCGGARLPCRPVPGLTVLVVDDDPVILRLLQVNFEMEGHRVITATDGAEGLARVHDGRPDVVVCDIMMPNVDGLQLLEQLRADAATAGLPVVLLSAKAQSYEIERGLEAGADDYITKPFDPLELVERVAAVVAR
ncbi:MAG: response regulator, partial [Chloroflexota bacterium]